MAQSIKIGLSYRGFARSQTGRRNFTKANLQIMTGLICKSLISGSPTVTLNDPSPNAANLSCEHFSWNLLDLSSEYCMFYPTLERHSGTLGKKDKEGMSFTVKKAYQSSVDTVKMEHKRCRYSTSALLVTSEMSIHLHI